MEIQMKQAPFQLAVGLMSLLLMAGCATPEARPVAMAKLKGGAAVPEETPEVKYPAVDLTPELLYQLLAAEIAGQRGQIGYALTNYLLAAESTRDPRLAERATHIALFARDTHYATRAARLWVEVDPENEEARQSLVSLLLGQQRYGEVEKHLEHLITLSSETVEHTFLKVAAVLARSSEAETALKLMGNLDAVQAGDPDALYGYAYLALQLNQLDLARQTIEQVIAQRPEAEEPAIIRARILQQQGKEDAALKTLEARIKGGKGSFPLRLTYGQMLIETNRVVQAKALFNQLEQEQPEDPDILMAQGLLALDRLEYERAENYFHRLMKIDEAAAQARFHLGRLAELQGDSEAAIEWYSSIREGAIMVDAQIRRAILTAQQGNMQGARQHLAWLSKQFPTQATHFQLAEGEILVSAERYMEALWFYDEVLKDNPDNTNFLYARAMVAENLGRLDILERDLRRILALDPNNAEALNALGYTLADRTDRLEEALHYISRALELKPNNPFILDSMGWVHYRLGDYNKAEKYLRQALAIRKDPEIAAHLGEVLWKKGDKSEARKVWQRSLEKNQDNKMLLEVMQRFQE
jgi:tetratricopeptide (TPR) repeat protein